MPAAVINIRADRPALSLVVVQLERVGAMLDFLMVALGVGFFVVAMLYVLACEKM
jgi:hypothetical protein